MNSVEKLKFVLSMIICTFFLAYASLSAVEDKTGMKFLSALFSWFGYLLGHKAREGTFIDGKDPDKNTDIFPEDKNDARYAGRGRHSDSWDFGRCQRTETVEFEDNLPCSTSVHRSIHPSSSCRYGRPSLDDFISEQVIKTRIGTCARELTMTEVKAKHILLDNEEHANQVKLSIERDEMSFEEAAKEKSEGPSGDNGGSLGWFGRGDMVKPFEKKAFEMDEGEISDPVKTKFGWHLIKKEDER